MRHLYIWSSIAAIVVVSTMGDVLLARAMKQVGDVGALWRRTSLLTVAGRILRNPYFMLGIAAMTVAFYSLLFGLSWVTSAWSLRLRLRSPSWPTPSPPRFFCMSALTAAAGWPRCSWRREWRCWPHKTHHGGTEITQ